MDVISANDREIFAQFPVELQMLIWGFLANLKSPLTKIAYQKDLKRFAIFLQEKWPQVILTQVCYEHVLSYRLSLEKKGGRGGRPAEPMTINRALAALKKFYRYLLQRGVVQKNPVELVDPLRVPKTVKTPALSLEEWENLLKIPAAPTLSGSLHQAVIALLFTTGMRKGELTQLRLQNLHKVEEGWILEYTAKGSKKIVKLLNQHAQQALLKYLQTCQEHGYSMNPESFLLRPSKNSHQRDFHEKPLQGKSIDYIVKKFCSHLGISGKNFCTHSARATVISVLYDKGVDLKKIRDFVGHSHIGMTVEYIKREASIKSGISSLLDVSTQ